MDFVCETALRFFRRNENLAYHNIYWNYADYTSPHIKHLQNCEQVKLIAHRSFMHLFIT